MIGKVMYMKLNKLILFVILFLIIFIFIIHTQVYAAASMGGIIDDAKDFVSGDIDTDKSIHISATSDKLQSLSKIINNVLLTVAIIAAFISIALMGINFMVQSSEEKAKVKESMIPFVIGAIISFGAFGIWKVTVLLLSSL